MTSPILSGMGWFGTALAVALVVGVAIVHLSFAVAVLIDTPRRRVLLPTPLWGLATLLGGVLVAGIYYALHYATCFEDRSPAHSAQRPPAPPE